LKPKCIIEKAAVCLRSGHLCVSSTLFKKKKTAFGEDFSRGMMPKKLPQLEEEENKEEVVDKVDVDEEGGGKYDDYFLVSCYLRV
jgi:hypothetical protein